MPRMSDSLPRVGVLALLSLLLLMPLAAGGRAWAAPPAKSLLAPPTAEGVPVAPVPDPHQAGVQWFAPTGHTLRGTFQDYWMKYGGLAQFGYPITEEFALSQGPTDQVPLTVQYFQRARFEHHPEHAGTDAQVELGILGTAFHAPDPPVPAQANPTAEYFGATGHNLNGAFKAYWHAHGGLFVNGYPISEPFAEVNPIDGKTYTVQYFQRERFELHPEHAGTPYEVELGLLGTQLARKLGYFGNPGPAPGSYPRFGHAADYSWIAGQVAITRIQGGCTFINYDANPGAGMNVQPVGDGWSAAQQAGLVTQGAAVVVFGHLAGPGEPVPMCPAKGYIVTSVIANAGQ